MGDNEGDWSRELEEIAVSHCVEWIVMPMRILRTMMRRTIDAEPWRWKKRVGRPESGSLEASCRIKFKGRCDIDGR